MQLAHAPQHRSRNPQSARRRRPDVMGADGRHARELLEGLRRSSYLPADPQGSALHSKVRHGVCYNIKQAERSVRRHRCPRSPTVLVSIGSRRISGSARRRRHSRCRSGRAGHGALLVALRGAVPRLVVWVNCVAALRAGAELRRSTSVAVDGRDGALRRRRALPVALLEPRICGKEGPRLAAGGLGGARRFGGAAVARGGAVV